MPGTTKTRHDVQHWLDASVEAMNAAAGRAESDHVADRLLSLAGPLRDATPSTLFRKRRVIDEALRLANVPQLVRGETVPQVRWFAEAAVRHWHTAVKIATQLASGHRPAAPRSRIRTAV